MHRMTWPRGYKTFFMLISAEHEIFSANKYENAIKLAFSYLLAEKMSSLAIFSKKEFAIVSNLDLLAGRISCSAELSMKKNFITSGP